MPEFGASDNGVDVCFDDVSFRYVDVNTDAAAAVSVAADTAVTADMETGKTGQIGGRSGVVGAGKTGMSKDGNGSVVALHGVSFTARRGQVTAIVGRPDPANPPPSNCSPEIFPDMKGVWSCGLEMRKTARRNGIASAIFPSNPLRKKSPSSPRKATFLQGRCATIC